MATRTSTKVTPTRTSKPVKSETQVPQEPTPVVQESEEKESLHATFSRAFGDLSRSEREQVFNKLEGPCVNDAKVGLIALPFDKRNGIVFRSTLIVIRLANGRYIEVSVPRGLDMGMPSMLQQETFQSLAQVVIQHLEAKDFATALSVAEEEYLKKATIEAAGDFLARQEDPVASFRKRVRLA